MLDASNPLSEFFLQPQNEGPEPTLTPLQPFEIAASSTKSKRQLQFEGFHKANPVVLRSIIKIAHFQKTQGWGKGSMKEIFERLRWTYRVQTRGDHYTLNNNYTSFYARS
jgi:hypothetical protein